MLVGTYSDGLNALTASASMASRLTRVSEHEVAEETKLEMMSARMNSSGRGRGASSERTAFFDLLLPTVGHRRVSHDNFIGVARDEALADLPRPCKPILAKVLTAARSASPGAAPTSRPSYWYAACLPAFQEYLKFIFRHTHLREIYDNE